MDLDNAVVTADAAHACRETAEYIAGKKQDGNRESDYFLFVKANQAGLQRAVFDAIQQGSPRDPDHTELDRSHGRIIRRSIWVAGADAIDFPHARQVARIRRDGYDPDGTLISKEIVHAVTSRPEDRATAAGLASIARGQWGIESVHWPRHRLGRSLLLPGGQFVTPLPGFCWSSQRRPGAATTFTPTSGPGLALRAGPGLERWSVRLS